MNKEREDTFMGLFDFLFKNNNQPSKPTQNKPAQNGGYSKPIMTGNLNNVEIPKPHVMRIKPAGVTFENRQEILKQIYKKKPPFDKQLNIEFRGVDFEGELAIEIWINNHMVGYVEKKRINEFVKHMEYGYKITRFTPGYDDQHRVYYCSIRIEFAK